MKSLWIRFTFLALIGICILAWLHYNQLEQEALELVKDQENMRVGYKASYTMYRLATKEAYDLAINTPQILAILRKGLNSSGKAQAKARGELYRELYPTYKSLSEKNLRQLHYQLPNGESYLRFHKPDRYGDSVFDARPSIRIANKTRQRVEGFEIGKVVSGYRYVYPLEYEGEFLGTVETSVPVKSILDALKELDSSREYTYIINGKIVKELLFEEQAHLYTASAINPDFYIEDALGELPDSPPPLSKTAQVINKELAKDKDFQKALKSGKPYGTFVRIQGESYSVVLQPMQGVERGVEGFLIAYQKDPTPQILSRNFWIVLSLSLAWASVILYLMYKEERKNKQILNHKEQLQTVIDTLSEGVYVMDTRGIIIDVNVTACMILGYTRLELIGQEAHRLFHAHKKDERIVPLEDCPIFEALQEGSSYRSTEEYFRHKDGSFIEIRVGANPIIESSGKIKSMVTVFSDITQEKADEAHRYLLTQALESSSNAMVITDKDAIIQWTNPAFENLTGFSPREAIGKRPKDLVYSGKQSQEFYLALWESILNGAPWSGEVVNKRKDGTLYTEELSITPVLDKSGEITHFIAIKQDISKRKSYEQNLKIAKENAELATRAKTDFLANMSHEIRTPLNAIIGLNELLSQTPLTPRQEELLKKTADSSKLLLHIVNDILDYSKIKAGELELSLDPVKLSEIIEQIESIFNESAVKKGINLVMQSPEPLPYLIKSDELRLLQILANLVGNGVKFTHEGGVELRVSILNQSIKKATLLFEVIDSGIGMSQEQLARVFEPFTQADTTITRRYGGSGLGLSIAKDLVNALGGELKIESLEGEGTTVSFILKVDVMEWDGKNSPVVNEVLPDLKECNILIIEDNPINQEVAKRMCERVGANVDVASDGEQGVAMFMKNPQKYGSILMDLQMPVMNGYEATGKIREVNMHVPIIALTAAVSTEDRQKVLAARMNEHLGKPIDSQRLYKYLKKWCKISANAKEINEEDKNKKPVILIVDDEPGNIQILSKILKDDYHIKVATGGEMALRVIGVQSQLDLILLDIMMPNVDGYTVCRQLKENPRTIHVPIIFTTAKTFPEEEARGLNLGAADYITKPYHPAVVKARIAHQIEFHQRQKELESLSMMDSLTKIPNRRYFDEHFETTFRESVRLGSAIALMIIDIDYFKPYNDHYGHGQGDRVLLEVAKCLQKSLKRPSDKIFRYGGEEFAVVLGSTGKDGALQVAEDLRKSVESLQIPHAYSKTSKVVTVSIGWALRTGSCDVDKATLFRYADEALYDAKSAGRNRVMMHELSRKSKSE